MNRAQRTTHAFVWMLMAAAIAMLILVALRVRASTPDLRAHHTDRAAP